MKLSSIDSQKINRSKQKTIARIKSPKRTTKELNPTSQNSEHKNQKYKTIRELQEINGSNENTNLR